MPLFLNLAAGSAIGLCSMVHLLDRIQISFKDTPVEQPPAPGGDAPAKRAGRARRAAIPDREDFGVPTNQGLQKTCWSYAIGNAVARAAQLQYGRILRPDDIAAWIKTELCWFKGTDPPGAVKYLAQRTADPDRPVAFGCYTKKGENLVPDGTAVCIEVKNIQEFSSEYVAVKGAKVKGKPVKQRLGMGDWPRLLDRLRQAPDAAVVSKWSKVEGDLCYGGHAMCFMEVLSDDAVLCKNSWLRKPTLTVSAQYFKRAVVFDVLLHEVGPARKGGAGGGAGGSRRAITTGPELPRTRGRPTDILWGHVDFARWDPTPFALLW